MIPARRLQDAAQEEAVQPAVRLRILAAVVGGSSPTGFIPGEDGYMLRTQIQLAF